MQTSESAALLRHQLRAGPAAANQARATILDAFERASGNAVHAAELLNVPHRILLKMMQDPGIASGVPRIRASAKPRREARS